MIAKIRADKKFEKKYKPTTEIKDKITPKISACWFLTFPKGMGLRQVLDIIPSISASYHILSAPDAPAPKATKNNEIAASTKLGFIGAITIPTRAVKITKDITLGFISSKKLFNIFVEAFTDVIDASVIFFHETFLVT